MKKNKATPAKMSPARSQTRRPPKPLLLLLAAGFFLCGAFLLYRFTRPYTPPSMHAEDIHFSENTQTIGGEDSEIINVLLVGQDRRITEERQRSDVMVLCTFNPEMEQITMTSFLRDLFVEIPGHGLDRLNEAYRLGGMDLLNETMALNFGLCINGNVEVDFSQFMKIIDEIGGVTVDVTAVEAEEINWMLDIDDIHEGEQTLTGIQALAYSRTRRIDSDFGRTGRQRKLLTSLYREVQDMQTTELVSLAAQILPDVNTNMSLMEIADYTTTLLPMVKSCELSSVHIPVRDGFVERDVDGKWVLIPDMDLNRAVIREALTGEGGAA